jgi:hypothetical protein
LAFELNHNMAMMRGELYNAAGHQMTGIAFTLDTAPPPGFRVQIAMLADGPAGPTEDGTYLYWGATDLYPDSPAVAGVNRLYWPQVKNPIAGGPALDTTRLASVLFQVSTRIDGATPFAFCVSDVSVLTDFGPS